MSDFFFPVPTARRRPLRNSFRWRWPENDPDNGEYARKIHGGIDIVALMGAKTGAPVSGLIIAAGVIPHLEALGKLLLIKYKVIHPGAAPTYRYIRMCHFNSFAPGIEVGVRVKREQYIAKVGKTGRALGPHIHFEWSSSPDWGNVKALYNPIVQLETARKAA